jgi:RNA polymerase sigma factor (TIGR02999 family)
MRRENLNVRRIGPKNPDPTPIGRDRWRRIGGVSAAPANPTSLLLAWGRGDQSALDQLMPLLDDELRRLARRHMARERVGHTLQATALVNEAYLRLIEVKQVRWQNRAHFFAMASRVMRRILVDAARARRFQKRGGGAEVVSLDEALVVSSEPRHELIALDDALNALAAIDLRKSQVVEMRFFAGLSVEETAEALHVSADTVMRDWRLARVWLLRELSGEQREGGR